MTETTEWERTDDLLQRFACDPPGLHEPFRVLRDEWHEPAAPTGHNPDCLPERTIHEWKSAC